MALRVDNTLTGEREPFEPQSDDEVLLYVCGLTVSDDPHLGHARTWVHADVFHRWLAYRGYDVRHVENVTDVNEKIAARAGEGDLGEDEAAVAETFTGRVLSAMRALNLKRAAVYPRVSEHVPEIIDLVETLVEGGYAYESGGSVYFDVTEFPEYGELSNQALDDIEAQGQDDELADKRNPQDFALWKAGPVDEDAVRDHAKVDHGADVPTGQTWDSPWGEGRPGWHVECSAMSMTHLGDTIDVHVGGRDLVFPHHENEIAQSEAATGERFSRYWLHVDLLDAGDEKMSSSLANFTTVEDAIAERGADVVRTFLLSATYDARQSYTADALAEAEERWERLERAYDRAVEACDSVDARTKVADDELRTAVDEAREAFGAAMDENFNTREALAALLDLTTAVNRHVDGHDEYDYRGLKRAVDAFEELGGGALGLSFGGADGGEVSVAEDLVELVVDLREDERAAGNYERADELRDRLRAAGVVVEDGDDGPTYRFE
jgi:cysteinyl-tRNA synthetase